MATIQYSRVVKVERLPVDAQNIVTRANIVLLGNRAGLTPVAFMNFYLSGSFPGFDQAVTYAPRPVLYRHVETNDLRAEARFDLKEGLDPFLPPESEGVPDPFSVGSFTNPGDPSAIRDGDPTTYASGSGTIQYAGVAKAVGFRLTYTSASGGTAGLLLHPNVLPVTTWATYTLPATTAPAEAYALLPLDARTARENLDSPGTPVNPTPPYGQLVGAPSNAQMSVTFPDGATVYGFYPLIPDEVRLAAIAEAQVRLPAQAPQRVTVRGYVAPDREHTIVGWPGGDFTGVVAQHQYELGRTVIDFEQAGAPTGLSAVSMQEARRQQVAVDRAVQKALYPVRMGERQ